VVTPTDDVNNDRWIIDGIEKFPDNFADIFNLLCPFDKGWREPQRMDICSPGDKLEEEILIDSRQ
jgi:hypothetical protein